MEHPLLHRLAIALGVGLIVGLERGWKTRLQHGGQRLAGIRTFALASLFGGVLAALADTDRFIVLGAGALVLGSPFTATAAAIGMSLLLGFKTEFHSVIEKLERHEMLATLQLLAIAAVLIPLLRSFCWSRSSAPR